MGPILVNGDDSYLTIPKKVNGKIKSLIYCSGECADSCLMIFNSSDLGQCDI